MKKLKRFDEFITESHLYDQKGEYVGVKIHPNSLELYLTAKGEEKIDTDDEMSLLEDNFMTEYFEDIQVNSDIIYHSDLGSSGFGLTEAPGFTIGYDINDHGEYVETSDSQLYYYNDYMIHSFVDILKKEGRVFFKKA